LGDDQKGQGDVEDDLCKSRFDVPLDDVEPGGYKPDQSKYEKNKDLLNDNANFHGLMKT
jgi:hypothetical protein